MLCAIARVVKRADESRCEVRVGGDVLVARWAYVSGDVLVAVVVVVVGGVVVVGRVKRRATAVRKGAGSQAGR